MRKMKAVSLIRTSAALALVLVLGGCGSLLRTDSVSYTHLTLPTNREV